NFRRGHSALFESLVRRLAGKIGRGRALVDDMALPDSGALHDPLIVGFHHLFQVLIRQQAGWHVGAKGTDFGPNQVLQNRLLQGKERRPFLSDLWLRGKNPEAYAGRRNLTPGRPLHTYEPVTVASFRTWRDWRDYVAWDPMP